MGGRDEGGSSVLDGALRRGIVCAGAGKRFPGFGGPQGFSEARRGLCEAPQNRQVGSAWFETTTSAVEIEHHVHRLAKRLRESGREAVKAISSLPR